MNQKIPAGVVTATDELTAGLERSGAVNVDDIARLWKVYTTQSAKIQDGVVCRLENLFWRIWGDPRLLRTLSGVTLAALFMAIHENGSFRTTPRQSLSTAAETSQSTKDTTKVTILTITNERDKDKPTTPSRKGSKNPLPPILKNSNREKSQPPSELSSYKTARVIIPPTQPSQKPTTKNAGIGTTNNGATTNKTVSATNSGSSNNAAQKQGRKKPTFVANTSASSRRRGVLMRRKSSQTSPLTSPALELEEGDLPILKNESEKPKNAESKEAALQSDFKDPEPPLWRSLPYLKLGGADEITSTQPSLAASPSTNSPPPTNFSASSVHRHRSLDEPPESKSRQKTVESSSSSSSSSSLSNANEEKAALVDRDFRTHFVERRKRQEPVISASSLTSNLSSPHIKDINTSTEAAAAAAETPGTHRSGSPATRHVVLPKHGSVTSPKISPLGVIPAGKSDSASGVSSQQTQQQHFHLHQHAGQEIHPSASTSVMTSQNTTSGVFSVPRQSQKEVGEQLSSLMKSK